MYPTVSKVDTRIDGYHDFADEDGLAVDVEHLDHGAHLGFQQVLDLVKGVLPSSEVTTGISID